MHFVDNCNGFAVSCGNDRAKMAPDSLFMAAEAMTVEYTCYCGRSNHVNNRSKNACRPSSLLLHSKNLVRRCWSGDCSSDDNVLLFAHCCLPVSAKAINGGVCQYMFNLLEQQRPSHFVLIIMMHSWLLIVMLPYFR